jgi:thioredoxin reductase (NADPH)
MDYELAIIGAGPAGYTAGIYASRAGIECIIFEKNQGGGLVNEAPIIENYTGFESIPGIELMNKMKQHAQKWVKIREFEEVLKLEKITEGVRLTTSQGIYKAKALLMCTGTEHRKLKVPGEEDLRGKGISYCATCDGFFFKNKKVLVVGGGNSALIEALYLHQIGCQVSLIHRRDVLRGEAALEQDMRNKGITIILNSVLEKIIGDTKVEKVQIQNVKTKKKTVLPIDGVFISIGEIPQSSLARNLDIALDEKGYIRVDHNQRTNIKGIYAAGDVAGGVKQIITACAQGAIAALTSTEVLGKQYPYY